MVKQKCVKRLNAPDIHTRETEQIQRYISRFVLNRQTKFSSYQFSGNTEFETIRRKLPVALLSHFHFPAKFLIGRVDCSTRVDRRWVSIL